MRIQDVPLRQIRRPLYRQNDPQKVEALMASIAEIGLQEPIDVLEVDGEYYGFSGCHRYEACTRLGHETIRCRVRRAPKSVLKMHLA
jgi:sulfiredoxin